MNQKMPEAKNLLSSYFSLFFELFEKQKKGIEKKYMCPCIQSSSCF